jgi:arsenate reductase
MLTIYHNPRCQKSRQGLRYLVDHKIEHEVVDYFRKPLDIPQLKMILMKLNLKPLEIVRIQEALYKKELKGRKFTDDEWLRILVSEPRLMMRPIVVAKYKAVIAIPPEKIAGLL